ncbi:MAG: beta-Ala-His dipeptidase [Muribaculaceae bacterium]|nr:beta-Ala-His dipeptidase [Muribaculaceae bacterium]
MNDIYVPSSQVVFDIFKRLNQEPRPSHHEERMADFLCDFARNLGLDYDRDSQNCVVIRKPASPGCEAAEPIVILNHMDMVCVAEPGRAFDPLNDAIEAYADGDWMKARGTSLGADNGIGLAMALAILQDDRIVHPALEVITTTNEEDGMTGAANLAPDFIKGRKVVNLDSEDYDTITTGAAGAYMQIHHLPIVWQSAPQAAQWLEVSISGGRGGHSGVDINKGRASATTLMVRLLGIINEYAPCYIAHLHVGDASASIAGAAKAIIAIEPGMSVDAPIRQFSEWLHEEYKDTDPAIACAATPATAQERVFEPACTRTLLTALEQTPQGVIKMSESLPGTVETSNNVGQIRTLADEVTVTTHTRSFIDEMMVDMGEAIKATFAQTHAHTELIMSAPAWQENPDSDFLRLTENTFNDVLGWKPRKVAMHFVLEAGFFVQKYPGIQMASIGPRIVEPHSTSERVQISTIHDIWRVTVNLLYRLAKQ